MIWDIWVLRMCQKTQLVAFVLAFLLNELKRVPSKNQINITLSASLLLVVWSLSVVPHSVEPGVHIQSTREADATGLDGPRFETAAGAVLRTVTAPWWLFQAPGGLGGCGFQRIKGHQMPNESKMATIGARPFPQICWAPSQGPCKTNSDLRIANWHP